MMIQALVQNPRRRHGVRNKPGLTTRRVGSAPLLSESDKLSYRDPFRRASLRLPFAGEHATWDL